MTRFSICGKWRKASRSLCLFFKQQFVIFKVFTSFPTLISAVSTNFGRMQRIPLSSTTWYRRWKFSNCSHFRLRGISTISGSFFMIFAELEMMEHQRLSTSNAIMSDPRSKNKNKCSRVSLGSASNGDSSPSSLEFSISSSSKASEKF